MMNFLKILMGVTKMITIAIKNLWKNYQILQKKEAGKNTPKWFETFKTKVFGSIFFGSGSSIPSCFGPADNKGELTYRFQLIDAR